MRSLRSRARSPPSALPAKPRYGPRRRTPRTPPHTLPLAALRPNPQQPRSAIDAAALEELAASIREHGVLQPLLISRGQDGAYVVIAGERRWRAAALAGLTELPVMVVDLSDADALQAALVENLQREDLSPLEAARAYQRLIERFGLTQEQVAARVGKSRATVTNTLRLLALPERLRASLAAGEISEGHARALLGAPDDEARLRLWEQVRARHLSVRDTEAAVRRLGIGDAPPSAARVLPGDVLARERLQSALGTKVTLQRRRRGGQILIHWYDDEQLEGLVAALLRGQGRPHEPLPDTITI